MVFREVTFVAALLILTAGCQPSPAPPSGPSEGAPDTNAVRVQWLADHAIAVRTVAPTDETWSDLAPLAAEIGDARLVMLGEQSHGDGTTFLAKTRLVRYLHQELDFDVLAFESGLFDVGKAWQLMQQGEDVHTAVRRAVFPIWTGSEQVQELFDYLGEAQVSPRPLELAGFDVQFTGTASVEFLVRDLEAFLSSIGSSVLADPGWIQARGLLQDLTQHLWRQANLMPTATERALLDAFLEQAGQEAEAHVQATGNQEAAFWSQMLESARRQAVIDGQDDPASGPLFAQTILRDRQMADNLLWLAETYSSRKIVVWAATFHEVRNLDALQLPESPGFYDGVVNMGHIVWQELGSATYTLGFTAATGEHGRWWDTPSRLDPPPTGSLEYLFEQTGFAHAVVGLQSIGEGGDWLLRPLVARPLGYAPMIARWPDHLDGMFFSRTMEASAEAVR